MDCKTCQRELPVEAFWKQNTKRGRMAECKECSSKRNREWVANNRDRFREINLEATHRYRTKDPRQWLLWNAKKRAKKAGIPFDLEYDDIEWPDICPVLGIKIDSYLGHGGKTGGRENSRSLDRIDPAKGYVKGNVVTISWRANRLKCDATPEEMRRLADFYGRYGSDKAGETPVS